MKGLGLYALFATCLFACVEKERASVSTPFTLIAPTQSGVEFINSLSNSEYQNILKYPSFYDGGGVAIGDINNDGLADIYFSSNQWENKLYLNKGDFRFEDITAKARVGAPGLWKSGVSMVDVNGDRLLDIYVCHGQNERNQLYVNNSDLTFTDKAQEYGLAYMGSSTQATFLDHDSDGDLDMSLLTDGKIVLYRNDQQHFIIIKDTTATHRERGIDIADVNEDGLNDIVTAGTFPFRDEIIRTTTLGSTNTLQINEGSFYTDVAAFAGVAATDFSWAPLLFDFDNDGYKDLFISTGVVGRPNDLEYINRVLDTTLDRLTIDQQLNRMPPGALPNFLFKGNGLQFSDVSLYMGTPEGLSNGAAYGDLDNDGDLDLVVNNINSKAFIIRNNLGSAHYFKIALEGATGNTLGVGASIKLYAGGRAQYREQRPVRGWLSSVDPVINIGLGENKTIDSVVIVWPGGKFQKLNNVDADGIISLKEADASGHWNYDRKSEPGLERASIVSFKHVENAFNTLDKQPLIPHASSTRGPKIVVADINGDKLEDIFICGGQAQPGGVFVQTRAGKFVAVPQPGFEEDKKNEEISAALFDVDGDRDADLMISSGGEEFLDKRTMLRLYLNNGRGTFVKTEKNLPKIYVNGPCIAPADVDNDGDIDVFVAGGVITGRYGFDSDSFILTNDGKGVFTGSPASFFERRNVGDMIQAAVWININNDEYPDLITAGDWTQIQAWVNEKGVLKRQFGNGIESIPAGWWTSLASADMDNDGDDDIVAGNFGTNQRIQKAQLVVADVDNNGSLEPIMTPLPPRDLLLKQVPALSKRYPTYADYADVTIDQVVPGKRQFERNVGMLHSIYIENLGNGKFKSKNLPDEAQFFPIFGIKLSDIDDDGNKDILLAGNLKAVPRELWRNDNGYGLVLKGDGKGDFKSIPPRQSGFVVKGEARDIQTVVNSKKEQFYLVTRNNDSLIVFKKKVK